MEQNNDMLARLSNDLATAVEQAGASTVTINARQRMPSTGIVWSSDGLIVTANSTVERDSDLTIGLPDGRSVPATLVGRDPGTDIALLRVEVTDLVPAVRDGAATRPGHLALAIGRPGPSGPMASFGVISLVGGAWRTQRGGQIDSFIRADVAMLPGFSGGPLVDAAGKVVGMNTSHLGRGGGMTIPASVIENVVSALKSHGRVRRGFFGIGAQAVALSSAVQNAAGTSQAQGLMVLSLNSGGPAELAGLYQGDLILSVHGAPVTTVEELQDRLTGDLVGSSVVVTVFRAGHVSNIDIVVAERTGPQQ